ncbi:MAG: biotin/lipoyl-binding protein, partial [Candidatus Krumholzibacteria bacterium]|nr:biotin/lipoyl-binding protein [Candidatus Krumholzibacteria bacterium]
MQKLTNLFGKPAAALLLVAAVAMAISLQRCTPGGGEDTAEEAVAVETARATRGTLEQTIRLSGDILAGRSVRLFGQIPDRLTDVLVDVGDPVRRGQTLARIRDEGVQAGVDQIEANLRASRVTLVNLRDEYTRTQRLFEAGAVSSQTLEGMRTQLEASEALEEQLQAALSAARASS